MQDFRRLVVWQLAHRLTLDIYRVTRGFPADEFYGVTSQIRRSSRSIPANIAEGCGRRTDLDFRRSLSYAMGSASETEYHLLLALDLGFLDTERHALLTEKCGDIKRMLSTFMDRLGKSKTKTIRRRADS